MKHNVFRSCDKIELEVLRTKGNIGIIELRTISYEKSEFISYTFDSPEEIDSIIDELEKLKLLILINTKTSKNG